MAHDLVASRAHTRPSRGVGLMDAREEALARIAALRLEAQVPSIVSVLSQAGATPIVLRSMVTLDRLLPGAGTGTSDLDLLVSPRRHRRARRTLAGIGFIRVDSVPHADVLQDRTGTRVDLHLTIPLVAVGPTEAWRVMCRHALASELGPAGIMVLDAAAQVVSLAARCAHRAHRVWEADDELQRAVAMTQPADRDEAHRIADALGLTSMVRRAFADAAAREAQPGPAEAPDAVDHGLP